MSHKHNLSRISNNRGESLIYVLAIMFFLMTICIATITAAQANFVYERNQQENAQAALFAQSIHDNIMFGLQYPIDTCYQCGTPAVFNPVSGGYDCPCGTPTFLLGRQIIDQIMAANPTAGAIIPLNVTFDAGVDPGGITVQSLELFFSQSPAPLRHLPSRAVYKPKSVGYEAPVCGVCDDTGINPVDGSAHACVPGLVPAGDFINEVKTRNEVQPWAPDAYLVPRVPERISIDAEMEVILTIDINGRIISSRAFYSFTGSFTDDPSGRYAGCAHPINMPCEGLGNDAALPGDTGCLPFWDESRSPPIHMRTICCWCGGPRTGAGTWNDRYLCDSPGIDYDFTGMSGWEVFRYESSMS
ncbi:MAG: hypothetical protein FWH20_04305 [Oscillospiraceae bacterium]|nr:hypothetical protein [Oscillospiraceae bacterium]